VGSFAQPEDFCPAIPIKKSFFESPRTVGFQKTIFIPIHKSLDFRLKRRKERQEVNVTNCQKSNDQ
jgi:hypothetical protein